MKAMNTNKNNRDFELKSSVDTLLEPRFSLDAATSNEALCRDTSFDIGRESRSGSPANRDFITPYSSPSKMTPPRTPKKQKRNKPETPTHPSDEPSPLFENNNHKLHQKYIKKMKGSKPVAPASLSNIHISPHLRAKYNETLQKLRDIQISSLRSSRKPAQPESGEPYPMPSSSSWNPLSPLSDFSKTVSSPEVLRALSAFTRIAEKLTPADTATMAEKAQSGDYSWASSLTGGVNAASDFYVEHASHIHLAIFAAVTLYHKLNRTDASFSLYLVVSGAILLASTNMARAAYVLCISASLSADAMIPPPNSEAPEPESDFPYTVTEEDLESLGSTLATLALTIFVGSSKLKDMPNNAFRGIGDWGKVSNSIKDITVSSIKFIDRIAQFVSVHLLKGTPYASFLVKSDSQLREIDERLKHISVLQYQGDEIECSTTNFTYVQVTGEIIKSFLKEAPKGRAADNQIRVLMCELRNIEKLISYMAAKRPSLSGNRPEPVSIMISSYPGSGKTIISLTLARVILAFLLNTFPEDFDGKDTTPEANIYFRIKSKFMDGFGDQQIVVKDDAWQEVDVPGADNSEALEFINMINATPFKPNMADIGDKGRTSFKAKLVILTSNALAPIVNSVHSNEAVLRRIDSTYVAVPKPEYVKTYDGRDPKSISIMSRALDRSKLPRNESGSTIITPDIHEFILVNSKGEQLESPVSFEVVAYRTMAAIVQKRKWHESFMRNIDEAVARYTGTPIANPESYTSGRGYPTPQELRDIMYSTDLEMEEMSNRFEDESSDASNSDAVSATSWDDPSYIPGSFYTPAETAIRDDRPMTPDITTDYPLNQYTPLIRECTQEFYATNKWSKHGVITHVNQFAHYCLEESHPFDWRLTYAMLVSFYGPQFHLLAMSDKFMTTDPYTYYVEYGYTDSTPLLEHAEPKVKTIYEKVTSYLSETYCKLSCGTARAFFKARSFYRENTVVIDSVLGILILLATAGALKSLADYFRKTLPIPESTNVGNRKKGHVAVKVDRTRLKEQFKEAMAEGFDPNGESVASSKARSNLYSFVVSSTTNPSGNKLGYVFVINNRTALIPLHFVSRIVAGCLEDKSRTKLNIKFVHLDPTRSFEMPTPDLINSFRTNSVLEDRDLALIELPNFVQPHKDILKHFMTDSGMTNLHSTFKARVDMPTFTENRCVISTAHFQKGITVRDHQTNSSYVLVRVIAHNCGTKPGDCGAPVSILDPSKEGVFAGIHAAGDSNYGYAPVITREILQDALKEHCAIPESGIAYNRFVYLRDAQQPPQVISSEFKRSLMYNQIPGNPPTMAPALLRPKEGVVPMENAYSKYCLNDSILDQNVLERIAAVKHDNLMRHDPVRDKPKLWTFEEALFGKIGDETAPPVNFSASSGYPFTLTPYKKKRDFVGPAPYDKTSSQYRDLERSSNEFLLALQAGKEVETIYTDFLKDELRPLAKVKSGSTRLVCGAAIDNTVVSRILCGDFVSHVLRGKIKNNSCLGINEVSVEWDLLRRHLTAFGKLVFAGDYSCYDGSHTVQLIMIVCHIINLYYNDEWSTAREMLFMSFANSIHIFDGKLWKWRGSMPSGNPLTPTINTIINEILMRYAFYYLVPSIDFDDHVVAAYVGDDNVVGPSEVVSDRFNAITLSVFMATIGYKYTDELKTGDIVALRPIEDVEFLKRKFRFDPEHGRYLAPLREESLMQSLQWTKKKQSDQIVADKVTKTIREYTQYGRTKFNQMVPMLMDVYVTCYKDRAIWPPSTNYDEVFDSIEREPLYM